MGDLDKSLGNAALAMDEAGGLNTLSGLSPQGTAPVGSCTVLAVSANSAAPLSRKEDQSANSFCQSQFLWGHPLAFLQLLIWMLVRVEGIYCALKAKRH